MDGLNDLNGCSIAWSEAVELLERLEPALFDEHQGITHSAKLKKRIRKLLTGTSVPLDTSVLMGDPRAHQFKSLAF